MRERGAGRWTVAFTVVAVAAWTIAGCGARGARAGDRAAADSFADDHTTAVDSGASGAGGGSGGASGAGGGGAGGMLGPIIGMPLGTFDSTLDGFFLSIDTFSGVIVGANAVQVNLGDYTTGLPRAELSHDATAGSPTPGCLKVSAPFAGTCCQFVEVLSGVTAPQDWSGRTLHARARVASGTFSGVAQLFLTSSILTYGWSTTTVPSDGSWHELTLDVSHPPTPALGFDPTQIIQVGLQFNTGENVDAPVVFNVDSFSIDPPVAPPDAAAD
jgi:hypothetical protein